MELVMLVDDGVIIVINIWGSALGLLRVFASLLFGGVSDGVQFDQLSALVTLALVSLVDSYLVLLVVICCILCSYR